jgi:hypothetical protein
VKKIGSPSKESDTMNFPAPDVGHGSDFMPEASPLVSVTKWKKENDRWLAEEWK